VSQQPTTRREDLLHQAGDDQELCAFINAISNTKIAELSDRIHNLFWKNDVAWDLYWHIVLDELDNMRNKILELSKAGDD